MATEDNPDFESGSDVPTGRGYLKVHRLESSDRGRKHDHEQTKIRRRMPQIIFSTSQSEGKVKSNLQNFVVGKGIR